MDEENDRRKPKTLGWTSENDRRKPVALGRIKGMTGESLYT